MARRACYTQTSVLYPQGVWFSRAGIGACKSASLTRSQLIWTPLVPGRMLSTSDAGSSSLCPTRRSLEARLELAVPGRVTPRGRGLPSTQAPRTRDWGLPGRGPSAGLCSRLAPPCLARCPSPQQAPPPSFVCIPGACVSPGSRHVYAGSLAQSCWRPRAPGLPGLGPQCPRRAH